MVAICFSPLALHRLRRIQNSSAATADVRQNASAIQVMMHGKGTSKNRSDVWPGDKVTDCDGTATMGYVQLPKVTVKDPVSSPVFLTSTTAVEGLLSAAMATQTIRSELHNCVDDICDTTTKFMRDIRACLHSVATLHMASQATHQASWLCSHP